MVDQILEGFAIVGSENILSVKATVDARGPTRICIIRPSALGDVCRSVPVLVSLRKAYPDAEIDWMVQDSFASVIEGHPDLTAVLPFPRDTFAGAATHPAALRQLVRWLGDLRRKSYDIVYDFQGLARSGFFSWFTRAPKRVGFRNAREAGYLGYTHRYRISPAVLHTVDRMLGLLEADGIDAVADLRLHVRPADEAAWDSLRRDLGVSESEPYAVLAPTSRWRGKQWPAERFAELVPDLLARGFGKILVVGAEAERSQCGALLSGSRGSVSADDQGPVVDCVGLTSIGVLMALIQGSELVIANDSAPLHMAVGFQRRYLGLFGPTESARVGPYQGERWVLQRVLPGEKFLHKNAQLGTAMMERITVQEVIGRLDELLSENPLACPQVVQD